jgi:polyhydroxyalkanoate synthase
MFLTTDILKIAKATKALQGVLQGSDLGRIFAWLRPDDLVWSYWVNNYLLGKDPPAFDVLFWNDDTTRLPAKFHGELDIYGESKLLKPGTMVILGRHVDLRRVSLDSYFTASITDHIAQWKHVYRNMMSYSGDRTFMLSATGHVQSVVNPPNTAARRQYLLNANDLQDPEDWLKGETSHQGTWWSHWLEWLQQRSGEQIDAHPELGSAKYPPITTAPGTYVFLN